MYRRAFLGLIFLPAIAKTARRPRVLHLEATAHSQEGETAAGTRSREGTAAADPRVLPLGSKVRVSGAGPYSGVYSIEDTGRGIKGREIDLYMKSDAEAKKIGRKRVKVTVLEYGKQ